MSSESRPAPADLSAEDRLLAFADSILAQAAAENVVRRTESQAYVCFHLGESRFGVPITFCREIMRIAEVTRIPEAPSEVRGVVNLRGRIIPVIELRLRVGLAPATLTASARVVVVESKGRLFGLLVDRVLGISKIAVADIDKDSGAPQDEVLAGRARLGGQMLMLFDTDKILMPARGESP